MERINVSVRARPLSPEEAKASPWRISGNSIFIPNQASKFEFDDIFREESKTIQVYKCRTKDIVASTVRGFNGTVFAYGQTNSGKTHTMRGSTDEPGVIPLAVHDLFETIQQESNREFLLRMSYMEIYNEEINDLLAPEHRKLQIHESIERGIFVAGLKEEIVVSPEQVLELMTFGESHRHTGETNMNLYSSRSHTIFRMIIESRDKTEDDNTENSCDAVRVSVLNLVDLAGSERAAKTGAEGARLKEGSHINRSLMTLGTVIKKLSEGAESQGSHVPYRDSKLTRILQSSLGGNANTTIICNITLAQIHADETKCSLQFASRALRVTNSVHVNEILTDAALLKRQKKEIEELRLKLQGAHSEHFEDEILNLRNTLLQTELERERIALELEEEKKAQAEREKRFQEQAKRIENLSSMVLSTSNRDEIREPYKKDKRRDTWCPGKLPNEAHWELYTPLKQEGFDKMALVPFEELVNEEDDINSLKQDEDSNKSLLPDSRVMVHVTSRRKLPLMKKTGPVVNSKLVNTQVEHEDILLSLGTLEDYRKVEVLASEMEATIASLEEKLETANLEKDQALSKLETLTSEMHSLSDELNASKSKICALEDVVSNLGSSLEESKSYNQIMETSVNCLSKEKEELAMQLADTLLAIEEDKAIWLSNEKENSNLHTTDKITLLSTEISQLKCHLKSSREECKVLEEKLAFLEANSDLEKKLRMEMSEENDRLCNDLISARDQIELSHENLKKQLLVITKERDELIVQNNQQPKYLNEEDLRKESYKEMLLRSKSEVEELTARISELEAKLHNEKVNNNKNTTMMRMRLRGSQAKLDTIRVRYKESIENLDRMSAEFKVAADKMKNQVTFYADEAHRYKKLYTESSNDQIIEPIFSV